MLLNGSSNRPTLVIVDNVTPTMSFRGIRLFYTVAPFSKGPRWHVALTLSREGTQVERVSYSVAKTRFAIRMLSQMLHVVLDDLLDVLHTCERMSCIGVPHCSAGSCVEPQFAYIEYFEVYGCT